MHLRECCGNVAVLRVAYNAATSAVGGLNGVLENLAGMLWARFVKHLFEMASFGSLFFPGRVKSHLEMLRDA